MYIESVPQNPRIPHGVGDGDGVSELIRVVFSVCVTYPAYSSLLCIYFFHSGTTLLRSIPVLRMHPVSRDRSPLQEGAGPVL